MMNQHRTIAFSNKPIWTILRVVANYRKSQLVTDLRRRHIRCCRNTLDKWLAGDTCDMDVQLLEQIINAYHVPSRFFFVDANAKESDEVLFVDDGWTDVSIDVRGPAVEIFFDNDANKSRTQSAIKMHPKTLKKLICAKSKDDLPDIKVSRFVEWINMLGGNIDAYIIDHNWVAPVPATEEPRLVAEEVHFSVNS